MSRKPPLYDENPVRGVHQFREPPGRDRFLTVAEFQSVLAACEDDIELKAAIIVYSVTTLRKGELIQRRWSEMHLDAPVPYVSVPHTKTGYSKKVPLPEVAVCALKLLPSYDRDEFVFPSRPTARWPNPKKPWRWDFGKEFRAACKRANVQNLRLHDLRHIGTSVLTEQGIPPEIIRKISGHRSDELDRYQHLSDRLKKQTVDLIAEVLFQQEAGSDQNTQGAVN
jgi:integrase